MTVAPEIVPAILEQPENARALEVLDGTVRRLQAGEVSPLDAIDTMLAEELTMRESTQDGVVMARLTTVKRWPDRNCPSGPCSTAIAC